MIATEYLEAKTEDIRKTIGQTQLCIQKRMYDSAESILRKAEKMYVEIDRELGNNTEDRKIAAPYITPVKNGLRATRLALEETRSAR